MLGGGVEVGVGVGRESGEVEVVVVEGGGMSRDDRGRILGIGIGMVEGVGIEIVGEAGIVGGGEREVGVGVERGREVEVVGGRRGGGRRTGRGGEWIEG